MEGEDYRYDDFTNDYLGLNPDYEYNPNGGLSFYDFEESYGGFETGGESLGFFGEQRGSPHPFLSTSPSLSSVRTTADVAAATAATDQPIATANPEEISTTGFDDSTLNLFQVETEYDFNPVSDFFGAVDYMAPITSLSPLSTPPRGDTAAKRLFGNLTPPSGSPGERPSPPRKKTRTGSSPIKNSVISVTDTATGETTVVDLSSASTNVSDIPLSAILQSGFVHSAAQASQKGDDELKRALQFVVTLFRDQIVDHFTRNVAPNVPPTFESPFLSGDALTFNSKWMAVSLYHVTKEFISYLKGLVTILASQPNGTAYGFSASEWNTALEWLKWLTYKDVALDLGLFFTLGEISTDVFDKSPKHANKTDNFLTCQETSLFLLFACKDNLTIDVDFSPVTAQPFTVSLSAPSRSSSSPKKFITCGSVKECLTTVYRTVYGDSFVTVNVKQLSVDYLCACLTKPGVLMNHRSGWYETCWLLRKGFASFVKERLKNDSDVVVWMEEYANRDLFTQEEYLEAKRSLNESIVEARDEFLLEKKEYETKHLGGAEMSHEKRNRMREYKRWNALENMSIEEYAIRLYNRKKPSQFEHVPDLEAFRFLKTAKSEEEKLSLLNAFLKQGSTNIINEENQHFYSSWENLNDMLSNWFNIYVLFFQQACANFTHEALMSTTTTPSGVNFSFAVSEEEKQIMANLDENDRETHAFLETTASATSAGDRNNEDEETPEFLKSPVKLYDNIEFALRGTPFVKQSARSKQRFWLRSQPGHQISPSKPRDEREASACTIVNRTTLEERSKIPNTEIYRPPIFNSLFNVARTIWKNLMETMEGTITPFANTEKMANAISESLAIREVISRVVSDFKWMEKIMENAEYDDRLSGYGEEFARTVEVRRTMVKLQKDAFCGILSLQNALDKLGIKWLAPTWDAQQQWLHSRALEAFTIKSTSRDIRKRLFIVECIDSFATVDLTWHYNFNMFEMIEALMQDEHHLGLSLIVNTVTLRNSFTRNARAHWISVHLPPLNRKQKIVQVMDTLEDAGNVQFDKRYRKLIHLAALEIYRYATNPPLYAAKKREQAAALGVPMPMPQIVTSNVPGPRAAAVAAWGVPSVVHRNLLDPEQRHDPSLLALSANANGASYTNGATAITSPIDLTSSPPGFSLRSLLAENADLASISIENTSSISLLNPDLSSEMRNAVSNVENIENACRENFKLHVEKFDSAIEEIDKIVETMVSSASGFAAAESPGLEEQKKVLNGCFEKLLSTLFSPNGLLFLSSNPSAVGTIGNNSLIQTWTNVIDPSSNPETQLTTLVSMLDHPNLSHVFTLHEQRKKTVFLNTKSENDILCALLNRLIVYCGTIDLVSIDPNETEILKEERKEKRKRFRKALGLMGNYGSSFQKTMVLTAYACVVNIQKRLPARNDDLNALFVQLINVDSKVDESTERKKSSESPTEEVLNKFIKGCYVKMLESLEKDTGGSLSELERLCFTSIKPIRSYATQDLTNLPIVLSLVQSEGSKTGRISSLIQKSVSTADRGTFPIPRLSTMLGDSHQAQKEKPVRYERTYIKALKGALKTSHAILFDKRTIEMALNRFQTSLEDLMIQTGLELNPVTGLYGHQHHHLLAFELTKLLKAIENFERTSNDAKAFYESLERRSAIADRPSGVPTKAQKEKEAKLRIKQKKIRTHLDFITNVQNGTPIPICKKKIWFKPYKVLPHLPQDVGEEEEVEEEALEEQRSDVKDIVARRFNIIAKALFPRLYPLQFEDLYEDFFFPVLLTCPSSSFVPEDFDLFFDEENAMEKDPNAMKNYVSKEGPKIKKAFETFDSNKRTKGPVEPTEKNTKVFPLLSISMGTVGGELAEVKKIKAPKLKTNDVPNVKGEIVVDDFNSNTFVENFGVPLFDSYSYDRTSMVVSFKRFFDELNEACQLSFHLNAFGPLVSPIPNQITFSPVSKKTATGDEEEDEEDDERTKLELLVNAQSDAFKKWRKKYDSYNASMEETRKALKDEITLFFVTSHPNGVTRVGERGSFEKVPAVRHFECKIETVSLFKTYCFLSDAVRTSVSNIFSMLNVIVESIPKSGGSNVSPRGGGGGLSSSTLLSSSAILQSTWSIPLKEVQQKMTHFKELVYGLSAIKKMLARCREHVEVAFNMNLSGAYDPTDYYGDQIGRCNLKTLLSIGTNDVFFKMMHVLIIGDGLNNLINVISVIQRFFHVMRVDGKAYLENQEKIASMKGTKAFEKKFEEVYMKASVPKIQATNLEELFYVLFSPPISRAPVDAGTKGRYEDAFTNQDEGNKSKYGVSPAVLMLETPEKWTTIIDEAFELRKTRLMTEEEGDFDYGEAWKNVTALCVSCLVGPVSVYEEFNAFFSEVYPLINEESGVSYHHSRPEQKKTKAGADRKGTTAGKEYTVTSFFASNVPNPLSSAQNAATKEKGGAISLLAEAREKWKKLFVNPIRKVRSSRDLMELREWMDAWSCDKSTRGNDEAFFKRHYILEPEASQNHKETMDPQTPPHVYPPRSPISLPELKKMGSGEKDSSPGALLLASVRFPIVKDTSESGAPNTLIAPMDVEEDEENVIIDLTSDKEDETEVKIGRSYDLDDDLFLELSSDVPKLSWTNSLLTNVLSKYKRLDRVKRELETFGFWNEIPGDHQNHEFLVEFLSQLAWTKAATDISFATNQIELTRALHELMIHTFINETVPSKTVKTTQNVLGLSGLPPGQMKLGNRTLYNVAYKTWLSFEFVEEQIQYQPVPLSNAHVALIFYRLCNDDKLWYEMCSCKLKMIMCGNEEDVVKLPRRRPPPRSPQREGYYGEREEEDEWSDEEETEERGASVEKFYSFYVETYDLKERKNPWFNDVNNAYYDFVRVDKPYLTDFDDRYEQKFVRLGTKKKEPKTTTTTTTKRSRSKSKGASESSAQSVDAGGGGSEPEMVNKNMPYVTSIVDFETRVFEEVKSTEKSPFTVEKVDKLVDRSLNEMPFKSESLHLYSKRTTLWTALQNLHRRKGYPIIVTHEKGAPNVSFLEGLPGNLTTGTVDNWVILDSLCDIFAISKTEATGGQPGSNNKDVFCVYTNGEIAGNAFYDSLKVVVPSMDNVVQNVPNGSLFIMSALKTYDDFVTNFVADVFVNNVVKHFVQNSDSFVGKLLLNGLKVSTQKAKAIEESEEGLGAAVRTFVSVFQSHREKLNLPDSPFTVLESSTVLSSYKKNADFRRRISGFINQFGLFQPSTTNFLRPMALIVKEGRYFDPEEGSLDDVFEPSRALRCNLLFSSVLVPFAKNVTKDVLDIQKKTTREFPFSFLDRNFENYGIEEGTAEHVCTGNALTNYKCSAFSREIPRHIFSGYLDLVRTYKKQNQPINVFDMRYANNQVNAMAVELEALVLEICLSSFKYDMFKETNDFKSDKNKYMKTTMYGHNSSDTIADVKQQRGSDFTYNKDAKFDVKRYCASRSRDNFVRSYRSKTMGDNPTEPFEVLKSHFCAAAFSNFFKSWVMMWTCRDRMTKPGFPISNVVGDVSNAMSLVMPLFMGYGMSLRRKWIKQMVAMRLAETMRINAGARFLSVPCVNLSKKSYRHAMDPKKRAARYTDSHKGTKTIKDMREELFQRSKPVFYNDAADLTAREGQNTHPLLPYMFVKRGESLKGDSSFDYEHTWVDVLCFSRSLTTILSRMPSVDGGALLDSDETQKHVGTDPFTKETSFLSTRQTFCRTQEYLASIENVIESLFDSFVRETESVESEDFKVDYRQSWLISNVKTGGSNCPQWVLANSLCDHFVSTFGLSGIVRNKKGRNEVEIGFDEESLLGTEMGLICLLSCWKVCLLKIANSDTLMMRNKNQERFPNDKKETDRVCIGAVVEVEYYHFICLVLLPLVLSSLKSKQGNIVYFAMGLFQSFVSFANAESLEAYKNVEALVEGEGDFATGESKNRAYCELTIQNDPLALLYYFAKHFDNFDVRDKSSLINSINDFDRKYILSTMTAKSDWIRARCKFLQEDDTLITVKIGENERFRRFVANPDVMDKWKAMNSCKGYGTALKLRKLYHDSAYTVRTEKYIANQLSYMKELPEKAQAEELQRRVMAYEKEEEVLVVQLEELTRKRDELQAQYEERKQSIRNAYDPKKEPYKGLQGLVEEEKLRFLFFGDNLKKITKDHWVEEKMVALLRRKKRAEDAILQLIVDPFVGEETKAERMQVFETNLADAERGIVQLNQELETIFFLLESYDRSKTATTTTTTATDSFVNVVTEINENIAVLIRQLENLRRQQTGAEAQNQGQMMSRLVVARAPPPPTTSVRMSRGTVASARPPPPPPSTTRVAQQQFNETTMNRATDTVIPPSNPSDDVSTRGFSSLQSKIQANHANFFLDNVSAARVECQICDENKKADYECTFVLKSTNERVKKKICSACYKKRLASSKKQ